VDVALNSELEIGDELGEDAAYELQYSGQRS